MNQSFSEKEILADALASQKSSTSNYNLFANECVHEEVRNTFMKVLDQEHAIQQDVFDMMHSKGYYPTPNAEEKKVEETKQKFESCTTGRNRMF
ncbi:MAG: spore coat protein [Velocimicrobium sp.]